MQFLITTFTDSSGIQHKHATKARENQTFTVVEAESKEEAMKIFKDKKRREEFIRGLRDLKLVTSRTRLDVFNEEADND
ncbi:DUF1381 domain-containing protein [Streptomyces sp. ID05-04B]|uniref:DUF1381 domain-containing protein n=1 Tax=Staphylococcus warneri TaxID=1292 RepID=A0ABS9NGV1_STAWA|nr:MULTISPECIES: DUF1381 domain-containing protein [Terrabacteria group]DAZ21413.1 MAG TPA: Protein of unknown function (DUF1381) [Caudoviricetes sp.]KTW23073.1 hypothetical protein SA10R_06650 [Staphylococcus warneri]MCG6209710.1 DUF1381 domain-containing protein [Staphylococcus warneri]MCG6225986.1 DUF1381 domain-containing protein [Staphylococcus warneri]MCG6246853.1 DUF1381 domain-containing protein [Staphylococcus warneri]